MDTLDLRWRPIYKVGRLAALCMLVLMVIQMSVYILYPPPSTVRGFYILLNDNWLLGLLSLDLLYILNNIILIPIYLSVYYALRRVNESIVLLALAIGLVGITSYFSSSISFEMLSLSNLYAKAETATLQSTYIAVGQSLLAVYKGTAFDVYYILNALILFIYSIVMLKSKIFSRAAALIGLLTAVLMSVPTSAGSLGMVLGITSLIPWAIWLILISRRFKN